MATYPQLSGLVTRLTPETAATGFSRKVIPYLIGGWLDDYDRSTKKSDIVETTVSGFSYLFDIANERLIAAWGISHGRDGRAIVSPRMFDTRRHPAHNVTCAGQFRLSARIDNPISFSDSIQLGITGYVSPN